MSHVGRRGTTFFVSLVLHAGLTVAVVALPLFLAEAMPNQEVIAVLPSLALAPSPPPLPPSGSPRLSAKRTQKPAETAIVTPLTDSVRVQENEPLSESTTSATATTSPA